jgi:hypothetical protein
MTLAEICVKPYVKTYLENKFGNPMCLPRKTLIGKYFYSLLEKSNERREKECVEYKAKITIKITQDVFFRNGYILSQTSLRDFNFLVEQEIFGKLYNEIDKLISKNYLIKDAIYEALEIYHLPPECMSYESIRKNYYRQRLRSESSVNIHQKGKRARVKTQNVTHK